MEKKVSTFMDVPVLTVVIPVYNAQDYLGHCLDSILGQSLAEVEVICVYDGSADDSVKIIEGYAKQDNRVILLKQENSYAGAARNHGMASARGKWITFIDADDFITPTGLEELYNLCEKNDLDYIKCSSFLYDNESKEISTSVWSENGKVIKAGLEYNRVYSFSEKTYGLYYVIDTPWSGVYSTTFLRDNDIKFPIQFSRNDHAFSVECLVNARRMMVSDVYLNYYRQNLNSSIVGKHIKHFDCQVRNYYLVRDIVSRLPAVLKKKIHEDELDALYWHYDQLKKKYTNLLEVNNYMVQFAKSFDVEDVGKDYLQTFPWHEEHEFFLQSQFLFPEGTDPMVSVVMAVYNTAPYLYKSVQSVLKQKFSALELICVDDGSTDGSLEILHGFQKYDKRINVIKAEHGGAAVAKAEGVATARGKYIMLLDSDDWLYEDAVAMAYAYAENYQADVVEFAYTIYDNESHYYNKRIISNLSDNTIPSCNVFNKDVIPEKFFQCFTTMLPKKIYRNELLKKNIGSGCREYKKSEDVPPVWHTVLEAKRAKLVNKPLFWYRKGREGSLETTWEKYPTAFLDPYADVYEALKKDKDYRYLLRSWANYVLREFVYYLSKADDSQIYGQVYDLLIDEGFSRVGLYDLEEEDLDYYPGNQRVFIRMKNHTDRISQDELVELMHDL